MEGHATDRLITIGQLSELTGVPVRTIRFYADEHLVEPVARSNAGYRLYDAMAAARLELVRTLRDLGIDLPTVAKVLAQEITVAEVARVHAEALGAQVRVLRLRQAVLRAVAVRGSDWEEMELMHRLAKLDAAERTRILDGFLDTVFKGLDGKGLDGGSGAGGKFETMIRASFPELPEDPTGEQVEAWVELVTLIQDEDFTARVRTMAQRGAAKHVSEEATVRHQEAFNTVLASRATQAYTEGIDPVSTDGTALAAAIAASYAQTTGNRDTPAWRATLIEDLEAFTDRRVYRFWELVALVSGDTTTVAVASPMIEALEWMITALQTAGRPAGVAS